MTRDNGELRLSTSPPAFFISGTRNVKLHVYACLSPSVAEREEYAEVSVDDGSNIQLLLGTYLVLSGRLRREGLSKLNTCLTVMSESEGLGLRSLSKTYLRVIGGR